jgi:hypothetical protein
MRKSLRYLRIAFSVTCGILCLLLIALWVRSYNRTGDWGSVGGIQWRSSQGKVLLLSPSHRFRVEPPPYYRSHTSYLHDYNAGTLTVIEPFDGPFVLHDGWKNRANWVVQAPHWFFVTLVAAFAAAPWLRWRFSLRTLLLAMTLVAVLLGVLVLIN